MRISIKCKYNLLPAGIMYQNFILFVKNYFTFNFGFDNLYL